MAVIMLRGVDEATRELKEWASPDWSVKSWIVGFKHQQGRHICKLKGVFKLMHSHKFRQWPTKRDTFTTITTNISRYEEPTWQQGKRMQKVRRRWRAGNRAPVLVYSGSPSVHLEPCEEADSVFISFWDGSSHRLQLTWSEVCWELKVSEHSRHNTHGGVMDKRMDKWNTRTFATERKGHIYTQSDTYIKHTAFYCTDDTSWVCEGCRWTS